MTADKPAPPRLAERLAALLVRDDRWREVTLGDLAEEFAARLSRGPVWRARGWYWWQALSLIPRRLGDPLRSFLAPTGDNLISSLLKEVRFACRTLAHQPLVTVIILITLALTLAANTVTFGMIDRMVLRPFRIPNVDRLVLLSESANPQNRRGGIAVSRAFEWREQVTAVRNLVAFSEFSVNFSGADQPERIDGQRVTAGFFDLLGAPLALGRPFNRDDEIPGQHRRVVLSDGLWRRRFEADPHVLGRALRLDGDNYEIVGVAPKGFDFPVGSQLWVPLDFREDDAAHRSTRSVSAIAERRPDRTLSDVSAEMAVIFARQQADDPAIDRRRRIIVWNFTEGMVDNGTPIMLGLLQTGAFLVLLIGCTNVASLLITRGADRQRDLAVRLALGASRGQLVRQLLVENVVLAAISVPLTLAAAWAIFQILQRAMPQPVVRFIPGWSDVGVDARLALLAFVGSLVAALLFGLVPALASSRVAPSATLRDGSRSVTLARHRLRRTLVALEIALSVPLLVASAMTALAGQRLAFGPQGYNPEGLYQLRVILAGRSYPDGTAQRRFTDRLLDAARQVPGVTRAAIASVLPSTNAYSDRAISIDGRADDRDNPRYVNYRQVSTDYFDVMEIPIVSGRSMTGADNQAAQRVSVITESLAQRHFPGESPLGRRIRIGSSDANWTTVVGISTDTIDDWINGRRVPTVYVPFAQFPDASVNLVVRTSGDPDQLADGLRHALASVDPEQPAFDARPIRQQVYERTTGLRFLAGLMASLGVLALLLAAIGVYGLTATSVAERRHEFGVRMALGASPTDVLALTVRQGATLIAIGIGLGVAAAIGLARVIENALLGVITSDVSIFVATTAVLLIVALVATVVPAARATCQDPAAVLKES